MAGRVQALRLHLALRLQASAEARRAEQATKALIAHKTALTKAKLSSKATGIRDAFRMLRAQRSPPLQYLKDQSGQVFTDPDNLDRLMRDSWQPIYQGNGQQVQVAVGFLRDFGPYLVQGPRVELGKLTPKQLQRAFRTSAPTAAGLDGWSPFELAQIPSRPC
eukprot:9061868-Alexandrium_andersonii.AAC.1